MINKDQDIQDMVRFGVDHRIKQHTSLLVAIAL